MQFISWKNRCCPHTRADSRKVFGSWVFRLSFDVHWSERDENLSSVLRDTTPGNRKPRCVYFPSIPLMRTTCRGRESSGPPSLSNLRHSNSPQTFFALSPCTINTQETHPCVGDSKVRGRSTRAVLRQVCLLGDITAAGWARPHQAGRRRAVFVSHAELIKNRSTACLDPMQWFELTLMTYSVFVSLLRSIVK